MQVNSCKSNNDSVASKHKLEINDQACDEPVAKKQQYLNSKKFIYGNYDRYYGYRAQNKMDVRIEVFKKHPELFQDKDILDIGCNDGFITIEISCNFTPKSVTGIDIDKKLIGKAKQRLKWIKKQNDPDHQLNSSVTFQSFNYVLKDEQLLSLDEERFDVITCLSVTKWIHLNFGDDGLKLAFKRMFKQLRPGGLLVLEAQEWKSYQKRNGLTNEIKNNYKNIQLKPEMFVQFLTGPNVGFEQFYALGIPDHIAKGFRRPINVFIKRKVCN